jgi:hypothetical protein
MTDPTAQGLSTRSVHAGEPRDPEGVIDTLLSLPPAVPCSPITCGVLALLLAIPTAYRR